MLMMTVSQHNCSNTLLFRWVVYELRQLAKLYGKDFFSKSFSPSYFTGFIDCSFYNNAKLIRVRAHILIPDLVIANQLILLFELPMIHLLDWLALFWQT